MPPPSPSSPRRSASPPPQTAPDPSLRKRPSRDRRTTAAAGLLVAAVAVIAFDLLGTSTEPSPIPPPEPGPCLVDGDGSSGSSSGPGLDGELVVGFDETEEIVTVDLRTCEVTVVALDPWPQRRFEAASMLLAGDEWVYVAGDGVFAVDRALDDPRRIATAEIFSAHDRQQVWLANGTDLRTYPIATALPDQPHDAVAFGSRVAWADADDVVRLVDGATAETWELGVGRPVGVTADEVVVRRAGPGRFETVGIDDSGASAVLAALDLQLGAFLPSPGGAALAATTSTAGVPARQRTVLVEPRSLAVDQLGAVPHSARPLVWRAAWIDDTRLALLVEDGNGDQSVSVHDRSTRTTRTVLVVERDTLASWLAAAPR